jgi:hypothetical protein
MWPLLYPQHGPLRSKSLGELLPRGRHLPQRSAPAPSAGNRGLCPGARALPHAGTQPLPRVLALGRSVLSHVPGTSPGAASCRAELAGVDPRPRGARPVENARIFRKPSLAQINHEMTVNNLGLHAKSHSRGRMTPDGRRTGYRSRVPWDGCGVEIRQGGLIRPGPPTTRASGKPAFFASRVRE